MFERAVRVIVVLIIAGVAYTYLPKFPYEQFIFIVLLVFGVAYVLGYDEIGRFRGRNTN